MFCLSVAPFQIEEEIYISLVICNRCYAVKEHRIRCALNVAVKSTPSETARPRKRSAYLNHSIRTMRCPVRKKAVREKTTKAKSDRTKPATYV